MLEPGCTTSIKYSNCFDNVMCSQPLFLKLVQITLNPSFTEKSWVFTLVCFVLDWLRVGGPCPPYERRRNETQLDGTCKVGTAHTFDAILELGIATPADRERSYPAKSCTVWSNSRFQP
jgi:hypothetical protein